MKLRSTFLLLLAVAGLFVFAKYFQWPTTRELEERKGRVVKIDRQKIDAIAIANNEMKIELRKRDGHWFLVAPVKDRADDVAVERILGSAELLKSEQTFPASEKGAAERVRDFGLATPAVRLKFAGKEAPPEILFGKDAAVPGKVYARLENGQTVFVIDEELKKLVAKSADEFRDHKLTELNTTQIHKFEIKSAAGELVAVKKGDHWQLEKPLNARADDQKVSDVIAQAVNARIDSFVSENEAKAATTGLAEPRGTVMLFAEGKEKPAILQIGQAPEKEKEKLYAKLSTRDGVYVLPKSVADILSTKPNDIRDKHLLRLNLDSVDRIRLEPAGREPIVLARKEENWLIKSAGDKPANGAEVRRLAANLQSQEVVAFVVDSASELPKYGLDKAAMKLTFSAYASENTSETTAGEKSIVSVHFGRTEGEIVYAKLEDEPFVVSLNKSVLEAMATDVSQWRDLEVFEFKPTAIEAVAVTKSARPPLEIVREKGEWKLAKTDGELNKINAESLVNTLASLRAVRWVGPAVPEHGFANPAVTIKFKAGGKAHKLTVGAKTPDGMWFAVADDQVLTFVVNDPDESALQLSLTQGAGTPAPNASPSLPTKPIELK